MVRREEDHKTAAAKVAKVATASKAAESAERTDMANVRLDEADQTCNLDAWRHHGPDGVWLDNRKLDVLAWKLRGGDDRSGSGEPLRSPREVMARAAKDAVPGGLRHLIVGVIGPREATKTQEALAKDVGRQLANLSLTVLCGGRSGVMEAVCAGVAEEGGLSLGFLPGIEPSDANPFVGIPLPTGLSEGRNMLIARSARVLIAIGGSYGTLTEIAFGLHFSKRVIGLDTAPHIEGLIRADSAHTAVDLACEALLAAAANGAGKAPQ